MSNDHNYKETENINARVFVSFSKPFWFDVQEHVDEVMSLLGDADAQSNTRFVALTLHDGSSVDVHVDEIKVVRDMS